MKGPARKYMNPRKRGEIGIKEQEGGDWKRDRMLPVQTMEVFYSRLKQITVFLRKDGALALKLPSCLIAATGWPWAYSFYLQGRNLTSVCSSPQNRDFGTALLANRIWRCKV